MGGLFRSRALLRPAMANKRGHQTHPRSLAGWPEIGQKPKMGATPATTATTNQKMQPDNSAQRRKRGKTKVMIGNKVQKADGRPKEERTTRRGKTKDPAKNREQR